MGFGLGGKESVFGLDIGFERLTLCELGKVNNKQAEVLGLCDFPITERILEKDRIRNKATTANMIKEACRKAKPNSIRAKKIISTLPETFVFSKTIQMPKMTDKELMIAVPNEAAQYLPIPLEDVYVDFQVLITHPNEPLIDVLFAAAPRKLVNDYVEMAKMAGMELAALETKPIAVGRALIPENSNEGIIILHIGTELVRISIWDKGKIRLVTTGSIGKNQLMEAINIADPRAKDVHNFEITDENKDSLIGVLSTMTNETEEAIRYHQNRGYKPSKITLIKITGTGAKIKGIDHYIENAIKIKAEIATPKIKTSLKIQPEFTTSFGLALREI